jgi:hypothetical protein
VRKERDRDYRQGRKRVKGRHKKKFMNEKLTSLRVKALGGKGDESKCKNNFFYMNET